jgi:hypothetical protein
MGTRECEETGAETVAHFIVVVVEFELIEGVLMLLYFLGDCGQ